MIHDLDFVRMRLERITGANEPGAALTIQVNRFGKRWTLDSQLHGHHYIDLIDRDPRRLVNRFLAKNLQEIMQRKIVEQDGRCAICQRRGHPMDPDHIVARSKERDDRPANIRAICRTPCHDERHGKVQWSKREVVACS